MATAAYTSWVRAGRPWKVMRPIKALGDRLRGYGYTVYYLGSDDASHLQASTPQDHCPFSVTGWPIAHPYPYVAALDIMPPPPGKGLPSLQQLGAQMVNDRNAGVPGISWIKYVNWEPDRDWGGRCFQDSWKPTHKRVNSSDRGHIHGSARSDMAESAVGDNYDPVARIRGTATPNPPTEEDDVQEFTVARRESDGQLMVCDGMTSRPVTNGELGDFVFLGEAEGRWRIRWDTAGKGIPRGGWTPAFGALAQPATLTDAQAAAQAERIAAALVARADNPLGQQDLPTIVAGVKQALREGTGS